jgi:hypothetical protein
MFGSTIENGYRRRLGLVTINAVGFTDASDQGCRRPQTAAGTRIPRINGDLGWTQEKEGVRFRRFSTFFATTASK